MCVPAPPVCFLPVSVWSECLCASACPGSPVSFYRYRYWNLCITLSCVLPLSSMSLNVGDRVRRGPDWKWGDQDGGAGNAGTITEAANANGWVGVKWDKGGSDKYRTQKAGGTDLVKTPEVVSLWKCTEPPGGGVAYRNSPSMEDRSSVSVSGGSIITAIDRVGVDGNWLKVVHESGMKYLPITKNGEVLFELQKVGSLQQEPSCKQGHRMARQEKGTLPATYIGVYTSVSCDVCRRRGLTQLCSHYFHCPKCGYDMCPTCAGVEEPPPPSLFGGAPAPTAGALATFAGGWKKGDRVASRVNQGVKNVLPGDMGTVMGPCEDAALVDKADRVTVNFDSKGLVNVCKSNIQGAADKATRDLFEAAKAGRNDELKRLIDLGGDVFWKNPYDSEMTALHYAALGGHVACVETLLRTNVRVVDSTTSLGATALHAAAVGGCKNCIGALLRANVRLDATKTDGDTALHRAACLKEDSDFRNERDVVRRAIRAGPKCTSSNILLPGRRGPQRDHAASRRSGGGGRGSSHHGGIHTAVSIHGR